MPADISSPNGKAEKMDVDRPKSPDRRSKAYATPIHFTVRRWTSSTDPGTNPPRLTALDALTVHVLATARGTETETAAIGTVTTTTTDAGVATTGTGLGPTATESGTETGTEIGSDGGIVMVSAVAVKETESKIDIAIEIGGRGTGNATRMTGTPVIDAESVEKTKTLLGMSEARGSGLTKVLKNRLYQPRHRLPACLHPHRLSLTAHVTALVPANLTAGTATGRLGVLATRGMTSTSLLATAVSASLAVP